jgi:hypothetical protein
MVNTHTAIRSFLLSSLLFAAFALLASAPAQAQFGKSSSHLGLMGGWGAGSGNATDQSSLYSQGTLDTQGVPWGIVFNLGGDSMSDGLGWGGFFSGTVGGMNEKFRRSNLGPGNSNQDGVWAEEFDLIGDFRLGLSANYRLSSQELVLKVRYFNWYNAGGLRAFHGNSDDPASLGLGAAWKRLGLDVDYGSDGIPGVLVAARDWSLLRIEARYKLAIWDDGRMMWLGGLRYEGGFLQRSAIANGSPDTTVNTVIAFISMGFND